MKNQNDRGVRMDPCGTPEKGGNETICATNNKLDTTSRQPVVNKSLKEFRTRGEGPNRIVLVVVWG